MSEAVVAPVFGVWETPGHSIRIEYADTVIQQIRMDAVDGYHRVPHGGVETGGILFGTHEGDQVRILAWRPIICEYATGPSFVLSDNDLAALAEALQVPGVDPELAGLLPVGWYHSHTRSEIFLSDQDLEIFQRYFPQPWQVALVVRPASFTPTRAGFFFREADGAVHAEKTYAEFQLIPSRQTEPPPFEAPPPQAKVPKPLVVLPLPDPEPAPALAEPEPELLIYRPRLSGLWKWYAAGLIAVVAVAVGAFGIWLLQSAPQRLSLSASDAGGHLHIAWDRAAGPVRSASGGSLVIEDHGVRTEAKLTQADLRSGSITYLRQSGDILVRLRVDQPGRAPVEEVTRFLKPGEGSLTAAAPPPVPQPDPAKEAMQREAAAMRSRIEQQDAQLTKLEKIVGALQSPRQTAPVPPPVRRIEAPAPAKAALKQAVIPQDNNVPQSKPLSPPPNVAAVASAPPTAVVTPAPVPAVPVSAPPSTPASGRIIWTGKFSKDGRLVIEGRRASAGAIVGTPPVGSAQVSAYPGDLTEEGMTLFSADKKYTRPQTEAAGPRNGWNRTTYMFDPKRAARVRIVEQPGPQNGYRLVLQSDTTKLGVVVLEWHAAQ